MRRILFMIVVVAASFLLLAGCEIFKGDPGKTYLSFTCDDYADGFLYTLAGYTGKADGSYYAIDEGAYSGDYVLYYEYGWSSYYGAYTWIFNTDVAITSPYSTATTSDALTYYANNYYSTYHWEMSFTVVANEGDYILQDGAAKYYDVYLDWYPDYSTISSNKVAMQETLIEKTADKVVKEFTDGKNTIRMELKRTNAPAQMMQFQMP